MVPLPGIEFQLPHLKTSSWTKIPRLNFSLNQGLWWVLSLIQKNLRPVQIFILCAVREELTYICRVCLTKFIL